jgi:cephalosporin hydroxylase
MVSRSKNININIKDLIDYQFLLSKVKPSVMINLLGLF